MRRKVFGVFDRLHGQTTTWVSKTIGCMLKGKPRASDLLQPQRIQWIKLMAKQFIEDRVLTHKDHEQTAEQNSSVETFLRCDKRRERPQHKGHKE